MDPSLRLVPTEGSKSASVKDTANSLGLHDTLQYGPRSIAAEVKTQSQIKNRLEKWEETQDNTKLNLLRNVQGLHAPMRLLMERRIVSHNPHMPGLYDNDANLALDILMGRDETIEPADIFSSVDVKQPMNLHTEMEKKRRI
ncbi:Proteasome maturation factor Ump1 [Pleurotus pulmonarius]|nr:hypothetical protein EYR36_006960 [Pleurotus pulmonarius]